MIVPIDGLFKKLRRTQSHFFYISHWCAGNANLKYLVSQQCPPILDKNGSSCDLQTPRITQEHANAANIQKYGVYLYIQHSLFRQSFREVK